MVHVMASIAVKPEHAVAAKALLVELATRSREEPGCLGYELFQRPDMPHEFRTFEQWQGAGHVDRHMQTPHVGAAIAAATPMFARPPEIVSLEKIG